MQAAVDVTFVLVQAAADTLLDTSYTESVLALFRPVISKLWMCCCGDGLFTGSHVLKMGGRDCCYLC